MAESMPDAAPTAHPPTPYYSDDSVTLYHGDAREIAAWLEADALVCDVPYGIRYRSGQRRQALARSIEGDTDTTVRDDILALWGDRPALIFGTWRIPRPSGTHTRLIWNTKGALGMGNLSVPWKPSDQEIYVLGYGFEGPRTNNVLTYAPVQSLGYNGRVHPHQKPLPLMADLIRKCPPGVIADPCAGSGSTLLAAVQEGRRAVGVELDERYCEVIAKRLQNGVDMPIVPMAEALGDCAHDWMLRPESDTHLCLICGEDS